MIYDTLTRHEKALLTKLALFTIIGFFMGLWVASWQNELIVKQYIKQHCELLADLKDINDKWYECSQ